MMSKWSTRTSSLRPPVEEHELAEREELEGAAEA